MGFSAPRQRILLADDDPVSRALFKAKLQQDGHQVEVVDNGVQAVESFLRAAPDLVILDVMMPGLNGYEAATQIKLLSKDNFVPILFLTALEDEASLLACVESGGDDFIQKTANITLVRAKIAALQRMSSLYRIQKLRSDELQLIEEQRQQEYQMAERIFANIVHKGCLDIPQIRYAVSPMSVFNGDILLAATTCDGGLNILLGDFTGHGLSAAIGAMPAAETFYVMTRKGFSIGHIASELNRKMKTILPVDKFLAAVLLSISPDMNTMAVWSGGVSDLLIQSAQGEIRQRIKSRHVPLGIMGPQYFNVGLDVISLQQGDRILAFTDGVTETHNEAGEMFGQSRLEEAIAGRNGQTLTERVGLALHAFRGGAQQLDDITLVEVEIDKNTHFEPAVLADEEVSLERDPTSWRLAYEFHADALKNNDVVPIILRTLTQIQGLSAHRERLFTVLVELFNNALDHGLLELDSGLKNSSEGFLQYYQIREQRLKELEHGWIRLELTHSPSNSGSGGVLEVVVEDSGKGFNSEACMDKVRTGEALTGHFAGRGLKLISSLCQSLHFTRDGTKASAIYHWG